MTESDKSERTTGGLLGRAVGKAKEVLGQATENNDLAREGRLQQAQGQAEHEAADAARRANTQQAQAQVREREVDAQRERRELENEVSAADREDQIAADRALAEQRAADQADAERAAAEAKLAAERTGAERSLQGAEEVRLAATGEANRLEREAREAEHRAERLENTHQGDDR